MPTISIIVPCYNYAWVLRETLDSVLGQTSTDWECLVVDDGSQDNTREVVQEYVDRDPRIRYLHRLNGGLSAARNTGIQAARGAFIQFLDADDMLAPSKLSVQAAYLQANPEVDVVYGNVRFFEHGNQQILSSTRNFIDLTQNWMTPLIGCGDAVVQALVQRNQLVVNAPLLRAELVATVGKFDEALRSLEDWDYWLRCATQGAVFAYLPTPETWALVRVHGESMSQDQDRMLRSEIRVRIRLHAELSVSSEASASQWVQLNERALIKLPEDILINHLKQGRWFEAAKAYAVLSRQTGNYSKNLRAVIYWMRHQRR